MKTRYDIEEERKSWNRIYEIEGHMRCKCPEKACVFCDHCTDVFWDYTNGPYMVFCDISADTEKGFIGHCELFKEEEND